MNAQELKSQITFTVKRVGYSELEVTAHLPVKASITTNECTIDLYPQSMEHIREQLKLNLLDQLYRDQYHEMGNALRQLALCSPMEYNEMRAAMNRVMELAGHTPLEIPVDSKPVIA